MPAPMIPRPTTPTVRISPATPDLLHVPTPDRHRSVARWCPRVGDMVATVITGVSRGLGSALFDELAHRGHRLLALGRHFTDDQRRLESDRIRLCEPDLS